MAEVSHWRRTLFHPRLTWVIVFAAVVRLVAVLFVHENNYYMTDERQYVHMAHRILDGQGFISENGELSTIAPLYIFFLAAVFKIFGSSLAVPHVLGCLLGIVIVVLVYLISVEVFKDEYTAVWCAGVCAAYPSLVLYSGLLVTETMYIVFFLSVFLAAFRMMKNMNLGMGVLIGMVAALATLTRAVFLGFLPVLLSAVWWMRRREGGHGFKTLVLASMVFCIVLSPWTIRNYSVHKAFIPVSTGGGKVLLAGNNPFAPESFRAEGFDEWVRGQAAVHGTPDLNALSEVELFSAYKSIALDFMASHPFETLMLAIQKLHIFWIYPIAHSDSAIPTQMFVTGADFLLYVGAAIGLAACWQHRNQFLLVFLAIGFFCLVQVVLHAESRFRLPLMPFFCMLCGYGLMVVTDRRMRGEYLRPGPGRIGLTVGIASIILIYGYTGVLFLTGKVS